MTTENKIKSHSSEHFHAAIFFKYNACKPMETSHSWHRMRMNRKPIVPFLATSPMMVIGPTNCSKMHWINRLLKNDMFTQLVSSILYCYGVYQEFFDKMHHNPDILCPIEFNQGLPSLDMGSFTSMSWMIWWKKLYSQRTWGHEKLAWEKISYKWQINNSCWIMGTWSSIVLPKYPIRYKFAWIYSPGKIHTHGICDDPIQCLDVRAWTCLRSKQGTLKKECISFNILPHNAHEKQMQKILQYLITPSQYTLLRELVVNELARNLPITKKKKPI